MQIKFYLFLPFVRNKLRELARGTRPADRPLLSRRPTATGRPSTNGIGGFSCRVN
jgi:hypothetical protein